VGLQIKKPSIGGLLGEKGLGEYFKDPKNSRLS
jgi:hypothetical protein